MTIVFFFFFFCHEWKQPQQKQKQREIPKKKCIHFQFKDLLTTKAGKKGVL